MVLGSFFKPVHIEPEKLEIRPKDKIYSKTHSNPPKHGNQRSKQTSHQFALDTYQEKIINDDKETEATSHLIQTYDPTERNTPKQDSLQDDFSEDGIKETTNQSSISKEVKLDRSRSTENDLDIQSDHPNTESQQKINKRTNNKFKTIIHLWKWSLLKNKAFLLLLLNNVMVEFALNLFVKFTPIRAKHEGVSAQDAALLVSVMSMCSLSMRIVVSIISNLPKVTI